MPVNGISMFWKKYYQDLFAALVLSLTLCIFYPIAVYQNNIGAVAFSLNDIWFGLLSFALIAFVASALLGVIIHKFFYRYIGIIYSSIIFGFWIQGNLLTYDLGTLDGHIIDWSMFRSYYILEFFVWASVIIAAIWLKKVISKRLDTLLVILLIFGVTPLLITGFEQSPKYKGVNTSFYLNYEHEFEFSSSQNVIIIILDSAQSDAFEQILAQNPVYRDTFKDFIFYKNALAGYPTTKPSIPLILSSEHFDNSITFPQFMTDTQNKSLPALLKADGYSVEYYSFTPFAYLDIWDNTSVKPSYSDLLTAIKKLYLVTSLRYLPLPFKPFVVDQYYHQGGSYWGRDVVDFYNASVKTSKVDKGPVFKFIHLTGPHPPYQLDNSLQFSPDSSYLNQFEGSLLAVDRFFKEMKAAGVYDNSLIFVMGDHGSLAPWDVQGALHISATGLMLNGMPLLLAKGFHQEQSELVISNAPVSSGDIPKSVMDALGLNNKLSGMSIFANIPENRKRTYYYYLWRNINWSSDFLPQSYLFQVDGNVHDPSAWQFKGDGFSNSKQTVLEPFYYQYGENIVSDANPYIRLFSSGFSSEGAKGAWATGPSSCLYLPIKESKGQLELSLSVLPFLEKEHLTKQNMNIIEDNQLIKALQLNSGMSITVPLSSKLMDGKELNLCFEFPDAKYSPQDFGVDSDSRHLGGFFQYLLVNEISPFSLPVEFNFGEKGNAASIKGAGWSYPEPEFTWTYGKTAELTLPISTNSIKDLKVTVSASPLVSGENLKEQLVIVRSNGVELNQWTMDHDGEYVVDIPSNHIRDGVLTIDFEIPKATTPSSLGIDQDTRILGMSVHWIRIEQ